MTGLPNRLTFVEHVAQELGERIVTLAVLLVDLDHFKRINDGFGHTAGDEVLKSIAMRLTDLMGTQGIVARFAGDEFVVAMPIGTEPDLHEFAETLRSLIAEPVTIGSAHLRLTASIGALLAHTGANVETLLRDADIAVYTAKKTVVTVTRCATTVARADAPPHRARDEPDERDHRGELLVHYQPLVDLSTNTAIGVEALVRWQRPGLGLIGPDDFLPLAEETGMIHRVDLWMLHHAIRQIADWHRHHLQLAGEPSVHELELPGLEAAIRRELTETGLAPSDLCLEVTETGYAARPTRRIALLQRLRGRPPRRHRRLRDGLLVDRAGAPVPDRRDQDRPQPHRADAGVDRDHAIVRSVIELAHTFELDAIAEGVETPAQHGALRDLGCDHAQGYLYGVPLPGDQLTTHLLAGLTPFDPAEHPDA